MQQSLLNYADLSDGVWVCFLEAFRTILVKPILKSEDRLTGARRMEGQDSWVEEVTNSELTALLHLLVRDCFSALIGSSFPRAEKAV